MSITFQYIIIALVLAGCIFFMIKSIRRLIHNKEEGCCNCKLKDCCRQKPAHP